MMKITCRDKGYILRIGYQKDNQYRLAFNSLAEKTFALSFEGWYQAGYWNDKYIPYTLFDGERAIANISVNIMNFNNFGERRRYSQLGTVMTDELYRNQGLSRFLMEFVIDEWREKSDLIYLFANSSVLEMYPKYGFERGEEYAYVKTLDKSFRANNLREFDQLDMSLQANRDRLHDYATNSKAFGSFSMRENADLILFYGLSVLKDSVFYSRSLDAIAIAQFKGNVLHLWDIFSKSEISVDDIIFSLVNHSGIDQVLLGFTPKNCHAYEVQKVSGDDFLFIQKGKTDLFEKHKLMFPLLSHA
jgi:GNAT superfamily N-acetyltransferase